MRWTKANVLARLAATHGPFIVDPFVVVTRERWRRERATVLDHIVTAELGALVAVRSSSSREADHPDRTAGMFRSELGIRGDDRSALASAIQAVFNSYGRGELRSQEDAVVVQRQLVDVALSAVVHVDQDRTYSRVDYDDESGSTIEVTRGRAGKTLHIWPTARGMAARWSRLNRAVRAVASELKAAPLRIELAINGEERVHVFQAQPITPSAHRTATANVQRGARQEAKRACRGTVLSDMADWNPAEMLGDRPTPLDLSLYECLVTDLAWADARSSLGYHRPSATKLLRVICGKPYVDVRKSLYSLLPTGVPSELAWEIVRVGLGELARHPDWHDKIEFRLAYSCVDLMKQRTQHLVDAGLPRRAVSIIQTILTQHTRSLLSGYSARLSEDLASTSQMLVRHEHRRHQFAEGSHPERVRLLKDTLLDCRDAGVVAFARHARVAFVVRDLFEQLVSANCLPSATLDGWVAGQPTLPVRVAKAIQRVVSGHTARSHFDEEFGHLRTKTYDLTASRYDAIHDISVLGGQEFVSHRARVPASVHTRIDRLFASAGAGLNSDSFLKVASDSICAREELKFRFSRLLSDALEWIAAIGEEVYGLDRQAMRLTKVDDLFRAGASPQSLRAERAFIRRKVDARQKERALQALMPLPPVIRSSIDIDLVMSPRPSPNFVTSGYAAAPVVCVDSGSIPSRDRVAGRIVLMEAAEPGSDWLFSCGIAGLVTKYGGMGSHVAVRCAAFGVPAAIGCGEDLFTSLSRSPSLILDCKARRIIPTAGAL